MRTNLITSIFCLLYITTLLPIAAQQQNIFYNLSESIDSLELLPSTKPIGGISVNARINSNGCGVAPFSDTLFYIYGKELFPNVEDRASQIRRNLIVLNAETNFDSDSIIIDTSNNTINIVYKRMKLMSVTDSDASAYGYSKLDIAKLYKKEIQDEVSKKQYLSRIWIWTKRLATTLLILILIALIIGIIQFGYKKIKTFIHLRRSKYLKEMVVKGYTILSITQQVRVLLFVFGTLRWFTVGLLLYLTLPIIFSIFPYTQGWADYMFKLIWLPMHELLLKIWDYLPNLISIIVTIVVMRYVIRFVRYIFVEIGSGKLVFNGFHSDWALPTYSIVKFLLYAFTLVIVFPKLPGASNDSFKGISVFIGLLISIGSSSAISNIVAGLVITYMRPFKIGDRIMLGNISGDVLEKSMLVTRLKTIKNEEITIPNSAILSGNTINYTTFSKDDGLIVHTTVTIGYEIPWKKMHNALIEAGLRTQFVEKKPLPFVLQTSLDDFYVAYQINVYTKEASRRALLLSSLHQNIQEVCRDNGIEIMSPHYKAERDGSPITIPKLELDENKGISIEK